jgi:hypothetical protein
VRVVLIHTATTADAVGSTLCVIKYLEQQLAEAKDKVATV